MSTQSKRLSGKVGVVTGASKGIGAAIAKALAAEGAAAVVNYASSREGADRVVSEIAGKGGKAVAMQANVAKKADNQTQERKVSMPNYHKLYTPQDSAVAFIDHHPQMLFGVANAVHVTLIV